MWPWEIFRGNFRVYFGHHSNVVDIRERVFRRRLNTIAFYCGCCGSFRLHFDGSPRPLTVLRRDIRIVASAAVPEFSQLGLVAPQQRYVARRRRPRVAGRDASDWGARVLQQTDTGGLANGPAEERPLQDVQPGQRSGSADRRRQRVDSQQRRQLGYDDALVAALGHILRGQPQAGGLRNAGQRRQSRITAAGLVAR